MKRNNKGFTLIELIMVIVIMGILAAVVVPKFFSFTAEAHTSHKAAVMGAIKSGLNLYAANELVDTGYRDFPNTGSLTFAAIMDEAPESSDWIITANGTTEDSIIYLGAGDGASATVWTYVETDGGGTANSTYVISAPISGRKTP